MPWMIAPVIWFAARPGSAPRRSRRSRPCARRARRGPLHLDFDEQRQPRVLLEVAAHADAAPVAALRVWPHPKRSAVVSMTSRSRASVMWREPELDRIDSAARPPTRPCATRARSCWRRPRAIGSCPVARPRSCDRSRPSGAGCRTAASSAGRAAVVVGEAHRDEAAVGVDAALHVEQAGGARVAAGELLLARPRHAHGRAARRDSRAASTSHSPRCLPPNAPPESVAMMRTRVSGTFSACATSCRTRNGACTPHCTVTPVVVPLGDRRTRLHRHVGDGRQPVARRPCARGRASGRPPHRRGAAAAGTSRAAARPVRPPSS